MFRRRLPFLNAQAGTTEGSTTKAKMAVELTPELGRVQTMLRQLLAH
jgi:hypothetical protein